LEPETTGERERALVVDADAEVREAETLDVLGERMQQRGADTAAPLIRQDARDREAACRVAPARNPAACKLAVAVGEQQESLGRGASAQLLDRIGPLVRDDGDAHAPPRLEIGVALAGTQRDHPDRFSFPFRFAYRSPTLK